MGLRKSNPRALHVACLQLVSLLAYSLTLKMEAKSLSETYADFRIPEDITVHINRCENLNTYGHAVV
jgi:hypothetical protein